MEKPIVSLMYFLIYLDLEFFLFTLTFHFIMHHDLHHNRCTLPSGTAAARRAAWLSALVRLRHFRGIRTKASASGVRARKLKSKV